jgi:RecA/RadA recombinase
MGKLVNIIGDSQSGKTLVAFNALAECARLPAFDGHRCIYDDAEEANEFDMVRMFGRKMVSRLEPPNTYKEMEQDEDTERVIHEKGDPRHSATIQDFQGNFYRAREEGVPFLYIEDSLDALSSEEEVEKTEKNIKLRDAGKETKGSYGMDKAKALTQMLRMFHRDLKETNSLLIIISQTRENIDPMSMETKTRAGGKALKFYACLELWTAVIGRVKSRDRVIGVDVRVRCKKNKITGKEREAVFRIYYDYGIDDIGSCIDFLVAEGFWKAKGAVSTKKNAKPTGEITATDLGVTLSRSALIQWIEDNNKEGALRRATGKAWNEIEESLRLGRKSRYE